MRELVEAAIEAALRAGEVLRRAFHEETNALPDREAEEVARAVLAARTPDVPVRGEEDGLSGPVVDRVWVVDPCDGTRHFERGLRGFAVSIALLLRGVPVVAVVYAPCAPDDAGDLFAWHEGGAVLRNGRPVSRTWDETPSTKTVLLFPPDADRSPFATARMVRPMRFVAMPSIAYRLALVAAGDASATASMANPHAHDVAAGEALVRAAGGVARSPDGTALRYTDDGVGGGNVFAGAPAVVDALGRLDPTPLFTTPRPDLGDVPCPLRRGRAAVDPGLLARAQGCLLGQLAGDSLGSLVEFLSPARIAAEHPAGLSELADGGTWQTLAGQPTDDSELALALARSIVREGRYDADAAQSAYVAWLGSGPFDVGGATRTSLSLAARSPGARPAPDEHVQGNGALMRLAPLAVHGHATDDDLLARMAADDAALTHPSRAARDANAVFAVACAFAVRTGAGPEAVHAHAVAFARRAGALDEVLARVEGAREAPPDFMKNQGWVLLSLHNAFHRLLVSPTTRDAIVDTVACGGDTDTHAAIAGALVGAVRGRDDVPPSWRRDVLSCRAAEEAGAVRVRPPWLWGTDAMVLAEALVLAGIRLSSPAMDLEAKFQDAQVRVKALSKSPSTDELLALYALFKQASVGDATGSRPGMLDVKGRAKFDAWAEKKGMSADAAREAYVALVDRLVARG